MTVPLSAYLVVGAALFALGAVGFLTRRNLIVLFLCVEMMLQGVALNLVSFARHHGNLQGQVFALFIITVAACEAGVALALVLMLYRARKSLDVSLWQDLRESDVEATVDVEPLPPTEFEEQPPRLPTTGRVPAGGGADRV
jgi:NADH-quinone oxidoreductase subunit K